MEVGYHPVVPYRGIHCQGLALGPSGNEQFAAARDLNGWVLAHWCASTGRGRRGHGAEVPSGWLQCAEEVCLSY